MLQLLNVPNIIEHDHNKKSNFVQKKIVSQNKILKKKRNGRSNVKFVNDIWNLDLSDLKSTQYNNQWINKQTALHNLKDTGKPEVKVHQSAHHKTNSLKKLQVPHPGTSYNPSYKSYHDHLENIVEEEKGVIKEKAHLKRVTTDMFSKIAAGADDDDSGNLVEHDSNLENSSQTEDDSSYNKFQVTKLHEKKSKKIRKKQEKLKKFQREHQIKKERKKQITDLHKLKTICSDISNEENRANESRKRRKELKEKKKFQVKRLSKLKFVETESDALMPIDICETLRGLRSNTKLLVTQFKNFQKRNMLPVSGDVGPHKKRKTKRFVRKSHKMLEV